MLEVLRSRVVLFALGALVGSWLVRWVVGGYRARARVHKLPGPPHSMLWGHLRVMGEVANDLPVKCHPRVIGLRIKQKYNLPHDYFYLDLWPVMPQTQMWIFDPDVAQQVTVDNPQPKSQMLADFLAHLAGVGDMVSSNGAQWKKWRSAFNPGFSSTHLMSMVPSIVDDSLIFCEKMAEHAKNGNVFRLEEAATRLTVDIIGKVALDLKLDTQNGDNEMVNAFREQVTLLPNDGLTDPLFMYWPYGIYRRWRNDRIMTSYIGKVLDERFARSDTAAASMAKKQRKRAIVDLALEAYQADGETEKGQTNSTVPVMDAEFRRMAITQIRVFIFAGHDTTSSTIAYAVYELQRNPKCLQRLREEHNTVLGSIENTPQLIQKDPHVLNQLHYTLAVAKETLRLWPAASSSRTGEPGSTIREPKTGELLPADGVYLWVEHYCIQRNPAVWGDTANVFDPTRFLPQNEGQLPENGWRPFEKGARNCIGQELALIEARVILALIARAFDFAPAYDSLHELENDGSYYAKNKKLRMGKQDLDGEPAYACLYGTAKPREGMPMRVRHAAKG